MRNNKSRRCGIIFVVAAKCIRLIPVKRRRDTLKAYGRLAVLSLGWATHSGVAQESADPIVKRIEAIEQSLGFLESRMARGLNDLLWIHRLESIARIDKVRYTGPPNPGTNKPGGTNALIISAYTFVPKKRARKYPLIVFAHGEIHGNMTTDEETVIVRELVEQGYAVIAPDYRGSAGYGGDFWHQIDYGGLEVEDVVAGRNWMVEQRPEIDSKRVGIIGWSHG